LRLNGRGCKTQGQQQAHETSKRFQFHFSIPPVLIIVKFILLSIIAPPRRGVKYIFSRHAVTTPPNVFRSFHRFENDVFLSFFCIF
jgi:hypothetical protein